MAEQSNINNNPAQAMLGMNMDSHPQQVKPGMLTYALNAQIDSFDGHMITYQNEQSNVLCSEFKAGFRVIGFHTIPEQNRTVLFMTNPYTGESEIGILNNLITCDVDEPTNLDKKTSSNYVNNGYNSICEDVACEGGSQVMSFYDMYRKLNPANNLKVNECCQYTTLISAKCLNFNINHPIHQAVHRIVDLNDDANKCGTEIYWADGLNPRRFINLDDLPFEDVIIDECQRVKSNVIDCDLMEVEPMVNIPTVKPLVVTDGGSIVAGSYQFAISYANNKAETFTSYYGVTNSIGVFRQRYGLDYNFQTDKSIKLFIGNLDHKFKYFNLAVIKTINGVTEVELVGTYEILKDSTEVVYSGNNKTQINLTINDIFQQYPSYRVASGVNASNDVLMWTGLKTDKRTNYQSVFNNLQLEWMTTQLPYNEHQGYNNGVNSALYRGYMRDEVYALEGVLLLKGGRQTDGFHIPAREAEASDLVEVTNDDVLVTELGSCETEEITQPSWKVYNTGSVIGKFPEYEASTNKDCYVGPYEYGKFAYWESEKTYPCNPKVWGKLAGKPIRHHKFPDNAVTHIYSANANATDKEFEHKIYPIGIKVDLENLRQAILKSDLTDEQKSQIIGYKIIRSDRANNKSVIAKGLLYNVGAYVPYAEGAPAQNQEVFYPNYPFNDLGDDPFLTNLSSVNDGGAGFSINRLDTLQNQVENVIQQLDGLEGNLVGVSGACYTLVTSCADDTTGSPVINVTNSNKADLQNKIFIAKNYGEDLLDAIQTILDTYNNRVQNGLAVCQDDVVSLTLAASFVDNFKTSITNINGSGAITEYQNIINYINTNSSVLNNNLKSNEIFSLRSTLVDITKANTELQNSPTKVQENFDNYNTELTELASISCTGTVVNDSSFSKGRFTFHSPDTSFYQPFLGSVLKFETVEGGPAIGNFVQVKEHAGHKLMSAFSAGIALGAGIAVGALFALEPKPHTLGAVPGPIYTAYYPDIPSVGTIAEKALFWNQQFKTLIDNLLPIKNYAYQYNAVGYYNNYNPVPNTGNKQRPLDKAYYLNPGLQTLGDIYPINNWKRESSVYFRTNRDMSSPLLPNDASIRGTLPEDDSRVEYSSDRQIYSNVLSYYASNKRRMRDQYGDIYSYETVDTGHTGLIDIKKDYTGKADHVFGGDIFINRFGFKRKLSYFIDTAVGRPDGIDIEYSNLSNIGRVKYWYNTSSAQTPGSGFKGLMKSILGVPQSNLDGNTNKLFYQNGRIYLYSYGISYFFSESEVNVDYRQAGNAEEKDFFPNVGTGIPNDWLQEVNVPIVHDNYYIYNKSYSKQNKESYISHLPLSFDPEQECQQDYSHRVVYSDTNKWRIYKPISYFDFPKNYGKLTSLDTITNNQVLVRFENKSYLYNALTAIQTSSGKYAYMGNDDVFKSQPIDFGETDQGYAGSQHHLLLRTESGHLFIDAKRGTVFLVNGSGVQPISDAGMKKWLGNNLEFQISKYFPNINIDNHFNGVGITGVWDSGYERFLITKLDYEPVKEFRANMSYDPYFGKFYYGKSEILLEDTKYFTNKSWTLSYHPGTKSWISFHSYIPNYYVGLNGVFLTGKNGTLSNQKSSVWIHNLVHTSYQRFYGKMEPYVLEYPFAFKAQDEILQNVKDYTTILEYYNQNDFYEINDNVYFNKAILYNNQQCSGVLNLYPKPKGRMHEYFKYPILKSDSKDIIFTKSDNYFNYNTFWDVVKNPNNHHPLWVESTKNKSYDKDLNNSRFDYSTRSHQKTRLRAKDLKVRHINDYHDRYKFISKFMLARTQVSFK